MTTEGKNNHYIYFHKKPNGEVFYVGQSNGLKRPFSKLGRSSHWRNLVAKHGYAVDIVHDELTKEQANTLEVHYITKFGRLDLGTGVLVNKTDGADGGSNIVLTDETRTKMSLSHKGERNVMFGKTHTKEASEKISNAHRGRKLSAERVNQIKAANTGRIKSASEIEKIRASKIGIARPYWVRAKVSAGRLKSQARKVIAVKDCAVYEFDSMKEAESTLQRQRKSITTAAVKNHLCNGFRIYL